jgi:hypothetical protein
MLINSKIGLLAFLWDQVAVLLVCYRFVIGLSGRNSRYAIELTPGKDNCYIMIKVFYISCKQPMVTNKASAETLNPWILMDLLAAIVTTSGIPLQGFDGSILSAGPQQGMKREDLSTS